MDVRFQIGTGKRNRRCHRCYTLLLPGEHVHLRIEAISGSVTKCINLCSDCLYHLGISVFKAMNE